MPNDTESNPYNINAAGAVALACGLIAVMTLLLEILTGRWHARIVGFGLPYLSVVLGALTPMLAGLAARSSPRSALPAGFLAIAYWTIFVVMTV